MMGVSSNGMRCGFREPFRRPIGWAMLLVYAALLLQPCAAAMGHDPVQHSGTCHDDYADPGLDACLSQPAADCATDDSIFGTNDTLRLADEGQAVAVLPVDCNSSGTVFTAAETYFSRAPPSGGVALNVRHCVYLK